MKNDIISHQIAPENTHTHMKTKKKMRVYQITSDPWIMLSPLLKNGASYHFPHLFPLPGMFCLHWFA